MLIRRRVAVFHQLVAEYELEVSVTLVPSAANRADELTRVPKEWLQPKKPAEQPPEPPVVAAVRKAASASELRAVHENIGHQGVRRTLWYARRELGTTRVTKSAVRAIVKSCQVCASIDPAPERWKHGSLEVERTWDRLAMDVTHFRGHLYLTLVDCGPSRYAIWRQLGRSEAGEIVKQLENIFLERGAPNEILTDNATEFRGRAMMALACPVGHQCNIPSSVRAWREWHCRKKSPNHQGDGHPPGMLCTRGRTPLQCHTKGRAGCRNGTDERSVPSSWGRRGSVSTDAGRIRPRAAASARASGRVPCRRCCVGAGSVETVAPLSLQREWLPK